MKKSDESTLIGVSALLHCKRADEIKVHSFFCDADERA